MPQDASQPLNFFDHQEEVNAQLAGKALFLFLDYDGTLTPIVATPDLAVISESMRRTVQDVSRKVSVSIVSGRATDDVRGKVGLEGIFYAGSHGFEIVDPQGAVTVNEEAQKIRGVIDAVHQKLSQTLKDVPGALVENVKYTISSHYRLVSDKDFPRVEQAVDEILKEYPALRKTQGKKVFEIRPKIAWDKGRAVAWIMAHLHFDPTKNIAVYIGDDTTDEDAFKALEGKGFGILVAEEPKSSAARFMVKNTEEVQKVLETFIQNTPA